MQACANSQYLDVFGLSADLQDWLICGPQADVVCHALFTNRICNLLLLVAGGVLWAGDGCLHAPLLPLLLRLRRLWSLQLKPAVFGWPVVPSGE